MKIDFGSTEKVQGIDTINGWSHCICGKCNRMFFQKSTLMNALEDYLEKWKDLPLTVSFHSIKNMDTGFMTVSLTISQIDMITKKQVEEIENGRKKHDDKKIESDKEILDAVFMIDNPSGIPLARYTNAKGKTVEIDVKFRKFRKPKLVLKEI